MDEQHVIESMTPNTISDTDWEPILLNCEMGAVVELLQELPMLMTPKQAAERATVSVGLIYHWCRSGELTHLRVGSLGRRGKILIEAGDLEGFLNSFKVTSNVPNGAPAPAPAKSAFRHLRVS